MNVIVYTERKYITTTQRIINITELNLGEHYKILSGKNKNKIWKYFTVRIEKLYTSPPKRVTEM